MSQLKIHVFEEAQRVSGGEKIAVGQYIFDYTGVRYLEIGVESDIELLLLYPKLQIVVFGDCIKKLSIETIFQRFSFIGNQVIFIIKTTCSIKIYIVAEKPADNLVGRSFRAHKCVAQVHI